MRDTARAELDRVESLKVGQGMLEAYAFGRGDLSDGVAGAALDYGHRLSRSLSVFGHAEAGYRWGDSKGLGWEAMAGVRGRW
jgi:hypothetical protein